MDTNKQLEKPKSKSNLLLSILAESESFTFCVCYTLIESKVKLDKSSESFRFSEIMTGSDRTPQIDGCSSILTLRSPGSPSTLMSPDGRLRTETKWSGG